MREGISARFDTGEAQIMQRADRVSALRHAGDNDGRDLSQRTGRQHHDRLDS